MRFFFLFLLASVAFGVPPIYLKDRVERAKANDYVVVEAGKMTTVAAIRANNGSSFIFEEISVPSNTLKNRPTSWSNWVKEKAPGHSSWSLTEIDLKTGDVLECYSFSRASFVRLSSQESFLATLLRLPMRYIPKEDLRKIGPPPLDGEPDHRKTWTPPLFHEGERIENISFEAFGVTWPEDGSELAGKDAILYFDKEGRSPLPFWIEVETTHLTVALKAIDSGKELASIYRSMPRRYPEFIGQPKKTPNGLQLSLKIPKYYRELELFAVDVTTSSKQICPISYYILEKEGEFLSLEISNEELEQNLNSDHRYTWMIMPTGFNESYAQSSQSFVWK